MNFNQLKANNIWECAQGEAKSGYMCKNMIYLDYHSLQHPAETFTAHVWDCLWKAQAQSGILKCPTTFLTRLKPVTTAKITYIGQIARDCYNCWRITLYVVWIIFCRIIFRSCSTCGSEKDQNPLKLEWLVQTFDPVTTFGLNEASFCFSKGQ